MLASLPEVQSKSTAEQVLKDSIWNGVTTQSNQQPTNCSVASLNASAVPGTVRESLMCKLQWASSELRGTTSVEYSISLCQLIKSCSEALQSVGSVRACLSGAD